MTKIDSPIVIGKRTCKNRITMAPTVKFAAGEDGIVTDYFVEHYRERAAGGCGLIVVEATCVDKEGRLAPSQLGLWCDEQIEGHKKIVEAVHKYGTLVIPQIHYGGLSTHPKCGPMVGPSKIWWDAGIRKGEAIELSREDIKRIIDEFIQAAIRAKKAGYDGVQLHACHAYLINAFASNANRRQDEYGGDAKNKARFGCEIIEGIRKACGEDFIISARISGCDPNPDEAFIVAQEYVDSGCDYLQVSCGIGEFESIPFDESVPYNRIANLGVRMHERFKGIVPVSTVNGFRNVDIIRYMFENDLIDTVDLGCGILADPRFPEAIMSDLPYTKCYNCPACAYGPDHPHPCPAKLKRDQFGCNPIIRDIYTADPAPMVSGDTLYLYTTHDEDELIDNFYTMFDWRCYSTKDMVNWTDHGCIFHIKDISWAEDRAWAPQCIERNGKFYLYCPVHKRDSGVAIAVGVSDSPVGPFKDLGYPLIDEGDWNDIDPTVFIDDDGKAYLYFGNPELRYVVLNEDMISYDQNIGIARIPMTEEAFDKGSHDTGTSYGEGPWFYKRGDLYYMVYASFRMGQKDESLSYSTSTSPTGPWKYGGVLMTEEGGVFTNHPGVCDFKGHSYLFYHTGDLPGGNLFHRSVCVAEFTYNEDGSIDTIPKCDGVNRI